VPIASFALVGEAPFLPETSQALFSPSWVNLVKKIGRCFQFLGHDKYQNSYHFRMAPVSNPYDFRMERVWEEYEDSMGTVSGMYGKRMGNA